MPSSSIVSHPPSQSVQKMTAQGEGPRMSDHVGLTDSTHNISESRVSFVVYHVEKAFRCGLTELLVYFWIFGIQVVIFLRKGIFLARIPLAFLVALYILVSAASLVLSLATTALVSTMHPSLRSLIHLFPYLSTLKLVVSSILSHVSPLMELIPSLCPRPLSLWIPWASSQISPPFSNLTDIQTSSFERLRNVSVAGTGIALDISRLGAITLPALMSMINHTDITGKAALIDALYDVAEFTPRASRSLQKFGGAVQESIAVVLGTNKVAMHRIKSGIGRSSSWLSTAAIPDVQLFERAILVFEGTIDTLNMAAVACNHDLNHLQALLGAVEKIVRELHWLESWEREMLLAELWTLVGGNRQRLAGHNHNIFWLEEALLFEKQAKENVVEARFILDGMSSRISGLKSRFGQPNILPGDEVALEIQYEVLATSIRQLAEIQSKGLERDEVYYRKIRLT